MESRNSWTKIYKVNNFFKNARCATRVHNRFLKTFSDRKIYFNASFRPGVFRNLNNFSLRKFKLDQDEYYIVTYIDANAAVSVI